MNRSVGTPLVWCPAFRRSGPRKASPRGRLAKAKTPNGRFMGSFQDSRIAHWDRGPASSGGTARQRLGVRQSSAAFPGMQRGGKRQRTGKTELELETCMQSEAPLTLILSPLRAGYLFSEVGRLPMSINLLIGEGWGNRTMVGQNHRRSPFMSCRFYSAGEPPCRDGPVALHDSVPL
jgi:hypothetical protein